LLADPSNSYKAYPENNLHVGQKINVIVENSADILSILPKQITSPMISNEELFCLLDMWIYRLDW